MSRHVLVGLSLFWLVVFASRSTAMAQDTDAPDAAEEATDADTTDTDAPEEAQVDEGETADGEDDEIRILPAGETVPSSEDEVEAPVDAEDTPVVAPPPSVVVEPTAGQPFAYGGAFREDVTEVDESFDGLEITGFTLLGVGVATAATGGILWTEVDEIGGQATLISGAALSLTGIALIYVSTVLDEPDPVPDADTDEPDAIPSVSMTPDGRGAAFGLAGRW